MVVPAKPEPITAQRSLSNDMALASLHQLSCWLIRGGGVYSAVESSSSRRPRDRAAIILQMCAVRVCKHPSFHTTRRGLADLLKERVGHLNELQRAVIRKPSRSGPFPPPRASRACEGRAPCRRMARCPAEAAPR